MDTVVKSDGKVSPSAAGKKLKQTRLPFQILSGSPATSPVAAKTTPTRKRKPSIEVDSSRATKIGRTSEAKENVKDSAAPVVVLDEDSIDTAAATDSPVVLVVEDNLPQTPTKEAEGESSGESAQKKKDDKIKIKFPIGKKKSRKSITGEKGSAKKKASKEKKKHKKEGKKNKVEETKAADQSIILDDSELSDSEKEDEKDDVEVEAAIVSKEKEEKEEKANDSEPITVSDEDVASGQSDKNEQTVEHVEKLETTEDVTLKSGTVEETNESKDEDVPSTQADKNKQTVEIVEKVEMTEETSSKPVTLEETDKSEQVIDLDPAEDQVNDAKKKEDDEAVTPRRTRLPRAASQKSSDPEAKTDQETPKRGRSTKKSADDKKLESTTPKAQKKAKGESEDQDKKDSAEKTQKPTGGALDKLFAKIQTESKTKSSNKTESNEKTPEKKSPKGKENPTEAMEVDQQTEEPAISQPANNSVISICLDDSTDGTPGADDEENAYMLCTPNSKERSLLGDDKQERKLTPKQLARRKEAEQRQAAKQQELEEKKKKKEEEREAKQREKEEQERLRKKEREEKEEQKRKEREEKEEQKRKEREEKEEQKRKEKEEKEEQKRKEREEKERKRLAEVEAKNEEKRKKDEQKEEERKKKEEEKEAEEKRKQKTAQAFQSFFVKKPGSKDVKQSDDENSMDRQSVCEGEVPPRLAFMPFCVKGDMRLAPVCRVLLEEDRKQRLEEVLAGKVNSSSKRGREGLYLQQLKDKDYVVGRSDRTWTAQDDEADDDDVMIVDDNVCHQIEVDPSAAPSRRYRAKFFLFEENRRPPYRGTWRKRSTQIKPRRPLVQDTKFFDYEVDSDDEWEEEEPGESLHGSDDEKDVDPEEDYEVDNDFFVPHGHLSDEEMQAEDDVMDDNSPETQKAKLKIMQQEFAAEMKKKTEKIKPRLIGCLWENGPGEGPECSAVILEILKARAMLFDPEEPISFTVQKNDPESNHTSPLKEKEPVERKPKQIKLVDEGVKELITLIHGCALNRKFLIKEFLAYWGKRRDEGEINVPQFAPDSIRTKILEVASWRPCPDEGPMQNKMCWYVNKEALVKYGLMDLKVPTGWEFILKPITKSKKERKQKKDEEANGEQNGEKKADQKKESPKEKDKNERLQSTPSSATKPKPTDAASSRITKFTKKLSEDDKRKQFAKEKRANASPAPSPSSSKKSRKSKSAAPVAAAASPSNVDAKPVAVKKRVQLLMSVPRGQNINQTTKSNLISQFLAKTADSSRKGSNNNAEAMEVDPPAVVSSGDNGDPTIIVLDD